NSSRKTLKTACFETLGSSELRDYLAADCGSMTSPDVNALPRWPQSSSWSVSLVRSIGGSSTDYAAYDRPLVADSVEKVSFSGSLPIKCAAVEMAASHFKLPSGVSLSVLAPV
ncbi:hypothetical protein JTL36_34420, partial [Pseudomonas aeruginosa]|nr:hypothetical protein [Pseudomonas aeruginosa]